MNFAGSSDSVCQNLDKNSMPKKCISISVSIVFSFSWELKWPQGKLKTMLMQNFGVTNKEYYGMLFPRVVNWENLLRQLVSPTET